MSSKVKIWHSKYKKKQGESSENFQNSGPGDHSRRLCVIGGDLVLPFGSGLYGEQYDVERHQ
jgi:hypothetical protein